MAEALHATKGGQAACLTAPQRQYLKSRPHRRATHLAQLNIRRAQSSVKAPCLRAARREAANICARPAFGVLARSLSRRSVHNQRRPRKFVVRAGNGKSGTQLGRNSGVPATKREGGPLRIRETTANLARQPRRGPHPQLRNKIMQIREQNSSPR